MNLTRALRLLVAIPLALGLLIGTAPEPADAYVLQPTFFDNDIIDTDSDGRFDLSVCFGDSTSQGVYIGRNDLMGMLKNAFGTKIAVGDTNVAGRAYSYGFVSSGVCNDDGSSVHIHYWNFGGSSPLAQVSEVEGNPAGGLYTRIRECHIYLNSGYTYSWEQPTEAGKVDGSSVVIHELLHCWGLDHSNPSGVHTSLMHAGHDTHHSRNINCDAYGETMWITTDDIIGAREVYEGFYFGTFLNAYLIDNTGAAGIQCSN